MVGAELEPAPDPIEGLEVREACGRRLARVAPRTRSIVGIDRDARGALECRIRVDTGVALVRRQDVCCLSYDRFENWAVLFDHRALRVRM